MLRIGLMTLVLMAAVMNASAQDTPKVDAALAKCPGAAEFRRLHPRAEPAAMAPAVPSQPALRDELLRMMARDQQARSGSWSAEDVQHMLAVDAEHLPRIKQIIAGQGFPRVEQVGRDGRSAAWILVQHADADPAFQMQVLTLVSALPADDFPAQERMLLTDRVLVAQGKPQRYGSQLLAVDGQWQVKPMDGTPQEVDARRAEQGEMPLADYICMATQMFPPPPSTP